MCGIVGAINGGTVIHDLMAGLKNVAYRGYDSAGVAILQDQEISRRRAQGKLDQLRDLLVHDPIDGAAGIGHTRWATHGVPSLTNAHPHKTNEVAVVHNGIIENFRELRDHLSALGHRFESDTDTEVIPHLITHYLSKGLSAEAAVKEATKQLQGAFALGVLMRDDPAHLYAARKGSPLVVGRAAHGAYLASDALALSEKARDMMYLEEGDLAVLGREEIEIHDAAHQKVTRPVQKRPSTTSSVHKGSYPHYMLKEIHEQPRAIADTIEATTDHLKNTGPNFKDLSRLSIVACGTSYYAACLAKYWFEKYAGLMVETDIASEFRYRDPHLPDQGAALFISQSGETADTLAALEFAKEKGQQIMALVNVADSTIARAADHVFLTRAGVEIGVASTKAFTTQLSLLALLAIHAGVQRGCLSPKEAQAHRKDLSRLPDHMADLLKDSAPAQHMACHLETAKSTLFIGRNTLFPLAMEGALKLKEISYIHAEGFGAGELKHGPLALVDEQTPVIALLPKNALFEKTLSSIHEVQARGARVLSIGPEEIGASMHYPVQDLGVFANPILYAAPLQLIAYHTALLRGCDVDQPRNLAKSVTVE